VGNPSLVVVKRVNMEELVDATILEEEEDDDLLVYCISEGAADILKYRKGKGDYCSLLGRYLMDSEMKFREFLRVRRDVSLLILSEMKADVTKIKKK
jgi:hypothetical protein